MIAPEYAVTGTDDRCPEGRLTLGSIHENVDTEAPQENWLSEVAMPMFGSMLLTSRSPVPVSEGLCF